MLLRNKNASKLMAGRAVLAATPGVHPPAHDLAAILSAARKFRDDVLEHDLERFKNVALAKRFFVRSVR